ncbi:MAG: hypothetical protein C4525_00195 [Desulfarculus sp.]|nr:MAG: hypothetical protein C4525_00195 [Desulfarculus sp.]
MSRTRALISSEALALLAVVCIAAIFLVASLDRDVDRNDRQAQELARQVQEMVQGPAAAPPLTLERLKSRGLKMPPGLHLEVQAPERGEWQISVWHQEGVKRYLVTAKGVLEQMR